MTEFADQPLILHEQGGKPPYAEENDACYSKTEKAESRIEIAVHIHFGNRQKQADGKGAFEHILIRGLAEFGVQYADSAQKPAQQDDQKDRHRRIERKGKTIHHFASFNKTNFMLNIAQNGKRNNKKMSGEKMQKGQKETTGKVT